jgi:hypothetical protein
MARLILFGLLAAALTTAIPIPQGGTRPSRPPPTPLPGGSPLVLLTLSSHGLTYDSRHQPARRSFSSINGPIHRQFDKPILARSGLSSRRFSHEFGIND